VLYGKRKGPSSRDLGESQGPKGTVAVYSTTDQKSSAEPALELWRGLFRGSEGYLALWILDRNKDTNKTRYFSYPKEAREAAEFALKESEKGRESYFAAHLLKAKRRKKYNAKPLLALYADADGAVVPTDKPQPGIRVASSPGKEHPKRPNSLISRSPTL
jgi:hypothetical protein